MAVRSMTGFARVRRSTALGEIAVTVKSVNHRSLDLHLHVNQDLEQYEPVLRQLVKAFASRGHVDLRLSFLPAHAGDAPALNHALFEAYMKAIEEAASEFGVKGHPDVNAALRIPGMLSAVRDEELPGALETEILDTAREALSQFNAFREREGADTVKLLLDIAAIIRTNGAAIGALRSEAAPAFRARLEERLGELLKGAALEPQRLAQEAAMLADKSDIAEEVGRLEVHTAELERMLEKGGELGKKLDFLLQEMGRETNTILSKSAGAGEYGLKITALGLEIRSNIERVREQGLNLE